MKFRVLTEIAKEDRQPPWLLRQLAGTRTDLFASRAQAEAALRPFGGRPLDALRFAQWRADCSPQAPGSWRRAGRAGQGGASLPPLLAAARAAAAWMESGIADLPTPLQAILAAVGAGPRVLPHTFAGSGPSAGTGRSAAKSRTGWAELAVDEMAESDRAVADALALARILRRLPGSGKTLFASVTAAAEMFDSLGAG